MDPLELAFAGAARQAELIRAGDVSSRELTELYLERIERLDKRLNAYRVVLAERALAAGYWDGRGAFWTINSVARYIAFSPTWNLTGQPAAAVPAGWNAAGLPLSVQLVGRPNAEGTLLSLAAQIEAERPWAERRPPIS